MHNVLSDRSQLSRKGGGRWASPACAAIFFGLLALPALVGTTFAQEASPAAVATDQITAFDQSNKPEDLELTRKIRSEIVKDDSLSQVAKNIQIITMHGSVTLKNQVNTSQEKWKLLAAAGTVAGTNNINDQIKVSGD